MMGPVSQYHIALLQMAEQELEITDGDEGTGAPNKSEYSGHVICLDQSEASIQVT